MASRSSTRQRILDAATDLFGARGTEAVSLDQIAAEVGVAKQTLLYWFPSKDDLVGAVLGAAVAELSVGIEAAIRASTDDPLDRVESVVRAVFRQAVKAPVQYWPLSCPWLKLPSPTMKPSPTVNSRAP